VFLIYFYGAFDEYKNSGGSRNLNEKDSERLMMKYNPNPIDLSDVALDASLESLVEALAENVHDTWAKGRMDDGWTFGPVRDDAKKHHPCLVPYEELPESEKEYDRHTSLETLKLIVKLGYKLTKD
jgi:ryanodine receptor 2